MRLSGAKCLTLWTERKWPYKRKVSPDRSARYKARLAIKGYEPKKSINNDETYAPVSKMATLQCVRIMGVRR